MLNDLKIEEMPPEFESDQKANEQIEALDKQKTDEKFRGPTFAPPLGKANSVDVRIELPA